MVDTKLLTTLENATAWINSNSIGEDEEDMPHVTDLYQIDSMDCSLANAQLPAHLAGSNADPLDSSGVFHTSTRHAILPTTMIPTERDPSDGQRPEEQPYMKLSLAYYITVTPKLDQ